MKEISSDVIKLLASKIKEPMKCKNDFNVTPLGLSISSNNLEMCKFFVEMLPIDNQSKIVTDHLHVLFGSAFLYFDMDIFEYLISKISKPEKNSLLHKLIGHYENWYCPKSKKCKYLEMFHILVPKLTQFQDTGSDGYTPLHLALAIRRLNNDKEDECAIEMIEYLAPRTKLEITNLNDFTPIILANAESIQEEDKRITPETVLGF